MRFYPRSTRTGLISAAAALAIAGAGVALADNPHFIRATAAIQTDGDLEFNFKEAGLGLGATDYLASADATTTCTCVNKGGQCPKAANKVTFSEEVSTEGTFSPKHGTVSATLVVTAPECPSSAPPTCGGGQTLKLSAITYTDISLADTTNGVSATGLPSSQSATFFTCP
jgi:hypothetical protein